MMNIIWPEFTLFGFHPKKNLSSSSESQPTIQASPLRHLLDIKLWGWSLLSVIPWAMNSRDNFQAPRTVNRGLKKRAQWKRDGADTLGNPVRFRPYVSKVPWHTGARAFLSQLFPRYGHYCGPNWSSGKDQGTLLWDRRPIDWLDFCCYCHDMGYDTHDQAKLLEADLAFLECLERPNMITKGNIHVANLYRTMCVQGLRNILIPYRTNLVKMQSGQSMNEFGWMSNIRGKGWNIKMNVKK